MSKTRINFKIFEIIVLTRFNVKLSIEFEAIFEKNRLLRFNPSIYFSESVINLVLSKI